MLPNLFECDEVLISNVLRNTTIHTTWLLTGLFGNHSAGVQQLSSFTI